MMQMHKMGNLSNTKLPYLDLRFILLHQNFIPVINETKLDKVVLELILVGEILTVIPAHTKIAFRNDTTRILVRLLWLHTGYKQPTYFLTVTVNWQ